VLEAIDVNPKLWDTPDALRARMHAINDTLGGYLIQAENVARNPAYSPDERADARTNAGILSHAIRQLGIPEGGVDSAATSVTAQEAFAMSTSEAIQFLQGLTDEQADALPPDVIEALRQRIQ